MLSAGVIDQKYQIVRQLGAGGMGAVYEARHLGTGRRVAVKVIVSDALQTQEAILTRFQREARAAGVIESVHIVQVLDSGVDAQTRHPYMVMEFLSGEDLQKTIVRLGPLAADLALRVVAQACMGLQKAHEAGIVHRDIKPANLFLTAQDGGGVLVKVLDFGIAKVAMDQLSREGGGSLTTTGSMMGSPYYMSPEQAIGAKTIDHRTDIWSLGVVLYEALGGRTPFAERDTIGSLILAIHSEAPPPVQERAPWVSNEVAAIVQRAIARDPAARFQSATEMLAAIDALLPYGRMLHESMVTPAARTSTEVRPQVITVAHAGSPAFGVPLPAAGSPAFGVPLPAAGSPAFGVHVQPRGFSASPPLSTNGGVEKPLVHRSGSAKLVTTSIVLSAIAAIGVGGLFAVRSHGNDHTVSAGLTDAPATGSSATSTTTTVTPTETVTIAPIATNESTSTGAPRASDLVDGGAAPHASASEGSTGHPVAHPPPPPPGRPPPQQPQPRPQPTKPTPTSHETDVF